MMKKILVVLLVLAVATGVFAQQGEWTISGNAKLDTDISFLKEDNPYNDVDGDTKPDGSHSNAATVFAGQYGDVGLSGALDIAYNRDGAKLYLGFSVGGGYLPSYGESGGINAGVEFNGDRYAFQAESSVAHLLFGDAGFRGGYISDLDDTDTGFLSGRFSTSFNKLWGYYELLNEMIHLEVAYKDRDANYWRSDDTAGSGWDGTDGQNLLLTDVKLGSLNFGILLPNLFTSLPYEFIEDVLKGAVFGLKFNMSPVEVAAQFKFRNYGAYVGAQWFAGPVTLGLSFQGEFEHNQAVRAGGKIAYSADVFGATLKAFIDRATINWDPETETAITPVGVFSVIGVEPSFWYNVLPETLRFSTDVGFYFYGSTVDGQKQTLEDSISWKVEPQLTWNFLQTGAAGIGDISTGMGVKYTLEYKTTNKLYVGFKFAF
jgi:uncharacterized protein YxeA